MSKISIHIGLHKTGTSFLQNNLLKNLPETSVVRGWYSHRQLMEMNLEKNLIISDEGISGRFLHKDYPLDFYTNIKKLKKIYGNPKIIFGIRNQKSFILSIYKQYLQEQGFESFNFLFDIHNMGLRKHEDFLLTPKIQYLQENFTNVFIYSQESLFERQSDFIDSLKEFLEIKGEINILKNSHDNIGVKTNLQVRYLKRLNKLSFMLKRIHPKLSLYTRPFRKLKITPGYICQHRLKNFKSKKFEIPNESKEFIEQYYKSDWVEASKTISY